jgi:hypothetical protein
MPKSSDSGKGCNPYPDYAAATESSSHRSGQTLRPSWGGNTQRTYTVQPSLASDQGADTGRGGGLRRLSHRTPPHLQSGYVDTDAIIARLLKPHPKLVAQAAVKDARRDEAVPGWRFVDGDSPTLRRPVDVYRPAPRQRTNVYRPATNSRSEPEPERANDRARYLAWSNAKLLREAEIRRLVYEWRDPDYLAEILLVNDRKFFEKLDEYQHLSIKQLLEEAEIERVSLAHDKYWDHGELLSELAENLAQVAVEHHNDLLQAEQVAQRQAAQVRPSVYSDRPSDRHQVLKMTNNGQKLKDRALKNKADSSHVARTQVRTPSNTAITHASKQKTPRSPPIQKEAEKKSTEARSGINRKIQTFMDKGSQHDDLGYFTGDGKSSTSQSTSMTPSIEDELPIDCSKEHITTRRNSEQGSLSKLVADKLRNEHANTKKRAHTTEDTDEFVEKPFKKMKISPVKVVPAPVAKRPRAQQPSSSSSDHDEDEDSEEVSTKPTKQGTKCKAERELTSETDPSSLDGNDSGSASTSGNERPKKKIAGRRVSKVQKTTKEPNPKKLRGITASERIPGMAYTVYADGSLGLIKRSAAARKVSKTVEPRYNYIK